VLRALAPPPPTLEIVEHDLVAPADRDDLPIAPPQRLVGPPAIFDEPRFPNGFDVATVDGRWTTILGRFDDGATGNGDPAWPTHPLYTDIDDLVHNIRVMMSAILVG
jgi:hypothetical protein